MSITTHLSRRTFAVVALCIGLVALVVGVQMAKPSKEQNQFAPSIKTVGSLHEPVKMRQGTLTFTKVRVAKKLVTTGLGKEDLTTSGMWLLVDYRFLPVRESDSMSPELYTSDNTKYPASNRAGGSTMSSNISGEPGFTKKGIVAFEVSKDVLSGSRVVVGNNGLFGLPLWDDQAIVPLGIDDAKARKLVADAPASIKVEE